MPVAYLLTGAGEWHRLWHLQFGGIIVPDRGQPHNRHASRESEMANTVRLAQLRENLVEHFDLEAPSGLCSRVGEVLAFVKCDEQGENHQNAMNRARTVTARGAG